GLHLLVNPNGSRLWRLKYRVGGKEKLLSIGRYPEVSIKMAREARDNARGLLAAGVDPSQAKQDAKRTAVEAVRDTFATIADEYVAKLTREGRAPATLGKVEWLLGLAKGALGERPIREIAAAEVLTVLRQNEARGVHETANRLRSTIGAVFRYAIASARAENDPTGALKGALTRPVVTARPAITEKKALGGLLRAVDGFDGQSTTRDALVLLAILAPRPGELRMARWAEFDLEGAVWTIPAERMKMRREHRVPLPRQALAILRRLHGLTGGGELVLPSVRSASRPISENTLNAALRRMGYASDEVTSHGFRATFSTIANESGKWKPDAIERALAHVENNDVRRAYHRAEYWEERVAMAQWWADLLDELRRSEERK
ncbi:integrase arm-type DNA-binding domain-containing protein, partial [Methylosinus sp. R-45379]|uniref:tyrosine-type recombinase/integrase n=1 Tax=Methylosinus sp. R-45379 TaxID=980563 RepID=UPI0009FD658C